MNDQRGVHIEVEGARGSLLAFEEELLEAPPRQARILEVERSWIPAEGDADFRIEESRGAGSPRVSILPDLATCPACLADVGRVGDRRFRYPFTNCTDCGPRFSIIVQLPYDRPRTTMAGFTQCPECEAEYTSPVDRRFHAQPNACPRCGPRLEWRGDASDTGDLRPQDDPLDRAAAAIDQGLVVAVQGLGGFHLMVDACSNEAVSRLRQRKGRGQKPFAVMVEDLDAARAIVDVDEASAGLLTSAAAPIALLPRRTGAAVAEAVAPGNPYLGVLLAYTPLHALLLEAVGRPVVATSGNRSEEPICIDADEAQDRLAGVADCFLVHDRPIRRAVDDSVARPGPEGPQLLRRSRGYAPLPLSLEFVDAPILAVGGHLKNSIAVARDGQVWLSQHIGDLEAPETVRAFRATVHDLLDLYRVNPRYVAHDLHPGYASTRFAREELDAPIERVAVQHHHAHLAAGLAEHGVELGGQALGVVWDGTGFGPDGTIWGGEFLTGGYRDYRRALHLRAFRLPGGEAAVREPRRSALGLLLEAGLDGHPGAAGALSRFDTVEERVLRQALDRGVNAPLTSSAGRLFDALASLLGLCHRSDYEGEAAMALEHAALTAPGNSEGAYPMEVVARPRVEGEDRETSGGASAGPHGGRLNWAPLVRAALDDLERGIGVDRIARRIHNGLAQGISEVAGAVGLVRVVLSGGCFHNVLLTREARARLRARGHDVLLHRQVPPGDGGLSLGQVAVVAALLDE